MADPPAHYYDDADGKTGSLLRAALHEIINDHTVIPHSGGSYDTHDALEDLDQDPFNSNNVILLYSGWSVAKSSWPDWNREHSWPKSYGTDSGPAYSDLHHIYSCDATVNSIRGNKYFDNGGSSIPAEAPDCRYDTDSFQVRFEDRGDLARAMFYMDVRYSGDRAGELDLELTDDTWRIVSDSRYMGRLSTLIEWHEEDPVDDKERARNDQIYFDMQHNRNPFVDQPGWVYSLWGGALVVDRFELSQANGGSITFDLDAGAAHAGQDAVLLATTSGTSPGTPLPGGLETLPLNQDWLTDYIIANLGVSPFDGFYQTLDASGKGTTVLSTGPLPAGLMPVGSVIDFAFTTVDPYDFVSNVIEVEIIP
jgi:endonuclease I